MSQQAAQTLANAMYVFAAAFALLVVVLVVKPECCEQCGRRRRLEAHHWRGYAKEHWLDVQWLCRSCHKLEHNNPYAPILEEWCRQVLERRAARAALSV